MTRYLYELQSSPVFLFLGCMIIATAAEWIAGHVLERIGHGKWWDYSNKKWNMDGYICLQYSVLWGILGVLALKFGNILGLTLLHLAPNGVMHITLWILFGVLVVDAIGSYAVLRHITKKMPRIAAMNDQIDAVIIDEAPAKEFVAANEGLTILPGNWVEEQYCAAVNEGNTELLNAINTALNELMDDGTVDEIIAKYISAE